ncbi:MAG: sodium:proton antiporter, partial [Spirochaetia bacterium]|nr:sodium:proton antiporter [Spirochaetia bacterium]
SFSVLVAEDSNPPAEDTQNQQEATENHTAAADHGDHHQDELAPWSVIPFVLLLLSIAIFPVASHSLAHWWEHNINKLYVSLGLSALALIVLIPKGYFHNVEHQLVYDYIPFIILLTSLFYISGAIVLRGDIEPKPMNNLIFLLVGASLASFIGTTGASMLLIRPLLKANEQRKKKVHTVIFFIFMVSNIGGSLTPLGDPPLFLGYLKGVPFEWTFKLVPEMVFAIAILSIIYFIWDTNAYKSEEDAVKQSKSNAEPISLVGGLNFLWLLGIIFCAAFLNAKFLPKFLPIPVDDHGSIGLYGFIREAGMILFIILSKVTSDPKFREENKFTWHPIQEVAYLFIGIFITMIPALVLLEANGKSLGVTQPWQFFWATGIFSSVLDNAPTYVVFLSLAQGLTGLSVAQIIASPEAEALLKAIAVGAVFMGANTYIGNAPNFMVKSVAEETKVPMPSFGGYLAYSMGILVPIFIVITFIFFK